MIRHRRAKPETSVKSPFGLPNSDDLTRRREGGVGGMRPHILPASFSHTLEIGKLR